MDPQLRAFLEGVVADHRCRPFARAINRSLDAYRLACVEGKGVTDSGCPVPGRGDGVLAEGEYIWYELLFSLGQIVAAPILMGMWAWAKGKAEGWWATRGLKIQRRGGSSDVEAEAGKVAADKELNGALPLD